jgi:HK97 family phage portal protein
VAGGFGVADRRFLPALRRRFLPATLETKALPDRVRASSSAYVVPGIPYSQNWHTKRAVEEAYRVNPVVYRAIEVICTNAISQRIQMRRGDPENGPEIDAAHDRTRLLYVLNRRSNPWETARVFRHRMVAQYLLSSKGVYIEVIRSHSNGYAMLNVVDPDLIEFVPDHADPMHAFRIRTPNSATGFDYLPRFDPEQDVRTQPSSILWIRSPDPLVQWQGMSPVQAAGLAIDLDRYAQLYNRRFLQNDGRPGGLLSIKGNVNPDTMEIIQSQFMGGPESAGRTTVIQADSTSYSDTSGSPRDTMWGDTMDRTRRDICTAFGVPESVLGDASGRTFSNADAEYAMFWEHRMLPLVRSLDDQLDILTGPDSADLYLRHDLSKVWVLGRYERERQDRLAADQEAGYISMDDVREAKGYTRLNVPATRVLWIPPGKLAVAMADNPHDAKEAAAAPIGGPVNAASMGSGAAQVGGAPNPSAGSGYAAGDTDYLGNSSGSSTGNADLRLLAGSGRGSGGGFENMSAVDDPRELEGKQGRPRRYGSPRGARHTA